MNIRVFALAGVVAAVCLVSMCAHAETSAPSPFSPQSVLLAVAAAPDPPGLHEWRSKLDTTKHQRRRGFVLVVVGAAGSTFLTAVNSENSSKWVLLGAAVSGYGIFEAVRASERLSDLREEGALKGYYKVRVSDGLSLTPVRGGVGARLALSF